MTTSALPTFGANADSSSKDPGRSTFRGSTTEAHQTTDQIPKPLVKSDSNAMMGLATGYLHPGAASVTGAAPAASRADAPSRPASLPPTGYQQQGIRPFSTFPYSPAAQQAPIETTVWAMRRSAWVRIRQRNGGEGISWYFGDRQARQWSRKVAPLQV